MAYETMSLHDWLDDLCVRFVINLPREELESVERICFQIEEAQWFYEDFIRSIDPSLPSMNLRMFSLCIFQHCPLLSQFSLNHHSAAFSEFLAYKTRVPVRGAILLNDAMDQVVLVKGWKKGANWSFPRGKINKDEADLDCAIREVYEETGLDVRAVGLVMSESETKYIDVSMREQNVRLFVFRGVSMNTHFEPKTRKEISKIAWYYLVDLPAFKKNKKAKNSVNEDVKKDSKFYMVAPFLGPLKKWINQQHRKDTARLAPTLNNLSTHAEQQGTETDLTAGEEEECTDIIAKELQMNGGNAVLPTGGRPMDDNMNRLLSRLRLSADGTEIPSVPIAYPKVESSSSAAAGLKELLSVGKPSQEPANSTSDARSPKSDMLLSMLQGNTSVTTCVEANEIRVLDAKSQQLIPTVTKNATNHIQSQSNTASHAPPRQDPIPAQYSLNSHLMTQAPMHQKKHIQSLNAGPIVATEQNAQAHLYSQHLDQPYSHTNDSQTPQPPNFPHRDLHKAPPASKLPPPKLNSHTMKLLNTLRQPTNKSSDTVSHNITNEKLIDNANADHHPLPPSSDFRSELEPQMGPGPALKVSGLDSSHVNTSQNNRSARGHLDGVQADASQKDKLISLLSSPKSSSVPFAPAASDQRPTANKFLMQQYPSPSGPSHSTPSGHISHISHNTNLPYRQDDRIKINVPATNPTPEDIPDATHRVRQVLKHSQNTTYPIHPDSDVCHAKTHESPSLKPSADTSSTHKPQSTILPYELNGSHVESSKLMPNMRQAHPGPEIRQTHQKQDIPAKSSHVPFLDRRDQVTREHKSNLLSLFSNSTPVATGSTPPITSANFSAETSKRQEEMLRESDPQKGGATQPPVNKDEATSLYNIIKPAASPVDRKFLLAYLEGVAKGGK